MPGGHGRSFLDIISVFLDIDLPVAVGWFEPLVYLLFTMMAQHDSLNDHPAERAALVARLREFETALVANTIGHLDPTPPDRWYLAGTIRSVTPTLPPSVGFAATCTLDSSTPGQSADTDSFWRQLEEMESGDVPTIWVVQCVGSRQDHECAVGDGMAKLLAAAGCVGIVTDGGVRDVQGLLSIRFSAHARGTVVHHVPMRFSAAGQPVQIGGVTIRAGDLLHGDAEGVITVPRGCWQALPDATARMRLVETEIHDQWRRRDLPLERKRCLVSEILEKHGFGARPNGEPPPGTVEPR